MSAWQRWASHVLTALVAATGSALFWMKYVLEADDPFALVNHAWQPAALALHVVSAPLMLLVFGALLEGHVLRKLRNGPHPASRRSGLGVWWTFVAMALSGYVLQVATSEAVRWFSLVVHLGSSALFVGAYAVHLVVSARRGRKTADAPAREGVAA